MHAVTGQVCHDSLVDIQLRFVVQVVQKIAFLVGQAIRIPEDICVIGRTMSPFPLL